MVLHQIILKSRICTHKFDAAAADPRLRFFGNVNVGTPSPIPHALSLPLSAILPYYTHVLFSTGCTVPILHPALPPSAYCVPALSIVHWYTQHPSRPAPPPLERLSHVTLIGQGNVSLDVARMLLTPPSALAQYDVPASVLAVLERSAIQHVSIVGRRGPLQQRSRWPHAPADAHVAAFAKGFEEPAREYTQDVVSGFLPLAHWDHSPRRRLSTIRNGTTVSSTHYTGLLLTRGPHRGDLTLPTSLVVTSLGHRADQVPHGWASGQRGRAHGAERVCDGWAATGARGVLASTMLDAYAVADVILRDQFPGEDVHTVSVGDAEEADFESIPQDEEVEVMPKEVDPDAVPPEVEAAYKEGNVVTMRIGRRWMLRRSSEVRDR
ncbi:NADPH:adrenodoxin oxidoreductase, mitochondrial [Grifola frondosa]|uniref:NADPH:adrenodoxin oxidoreductase, mitochondrial n=1 Tax=Grifola frondosa TaxID=5627 RepID=A0A1C7M9I4_GRIFR|nr:NADPH:adrenodoxin oxidoreductase, mitochondrial [Grifola frondosa]